MWYVATKPSAAGKEATVMPSSEWITTKFDHCFHLYLTARNAHK